jgi:hypothetical protein
MKGLSGKPWFTPTLPGGYLMTEAILTLDG